MTTVIISDTHFGRPSGAAISAAALRPVWQGADRLIVNGDVAEVHHPTFRAEACRQTLLLHDLCEADGVELTLISGNHDPFISDLRHLHLAGGSVLVMHGDALHESIAPWSPSAAKLRAAHEAALQRAEVHEPLTLELRLGAAQHASHAEWLTDDEHRGCSLPILLRPWLVLKVLAYWRRIPHLAAAFAAAHAPATRYVVLGHTHRPAIDRIGDCTVINTGCYGFPGSPRAVVLDDDTLLVRRIRRRGDVYEMDAAHDAAFTLRAEAERRAA